MRLLYVPNERSEGDQIGPRQAFEQFHRDGDLGAYHAYSYLVRSQAIRNHQEALRELLAVTNSFRPDLILLQHTQDYYPLDREYLRQLKTVAGRAKLVLYEGDAYGKFVKRLDRTMKNVIAECDMVILTGTGSLAELVRKAGSRCIRFVPDSYDSVRFDTPWTPTRTRKWDAVMIGNLSVLKRLPFLYMPGGARRKSIARRLYQYFGNRFALFGDGAGWKNEPYCHGRLPFDQQGDVIRNSWVSVNWGIFDGIAMYSSDRLAISLASGVPHVTNYQPGYEHVYGNVPGLFIVRSPTEVTDVALYINSLPIDSRIELGLRASQYARENLHATVVYKRLLSIFKEQLNGEGGTEL